MTGSAMPGHLTLFNLKVGMKTCDVIIAAPALKSTKLCMTELSSSSLQITGHIAAGTPGNTCTHDTRQALAELHCAGLHITAILFAAIVALFTINHKNSRGYAPTDRDV